MTNQVTETSHPPTRPMMCDNGCGRASTRWFGQTNVRICDDPACREHYQTEWDKAFTEVHDD